jgi:CBS domain-containing protein
MNTTSPRTYQKQLVLNLERARDLMTPHPISIPATATVKEAVAVLVDKGISAAPVVDVLGQPVGVLSQTDIVIHYRNKSESAPPVPEYYQRTDLSADGSTWLARFRFDQSDRTLVHQVMTPTVIAVGPDDAVVRVVGQMVAFKVHRLFVVAENGVLVGVISAFDVLRKLRTEGQAPATIGDRAPDDEPLCDF